MSETQRASELSDAELIDRILAADPDDTRAFTALVERFQGPVLTNCRFITGSVDDAPDLAQEVMVKVYFGLPRFEGRAGLKTWIQRIKTNHCINFVKKRRPTFVDVDDQKMESAESMRVEPAVEEKLENRSRKQRIEDTLERMTDSLRIPLVLRDFDGLSYDEIAEELGIGLSAVKMRIKRGRERFRALFTIEPSASPEEKAPHG